MTGYDFEAREDAIAELAPIEDGGSGQVVTITTPGQSGLSDPMTDRATGSSPPVTQYSSGVEVSYKADSIDGTVIQRGDVQFLLSPVTLEGADLAEITPDITTLTKGDGQWLVKDVETIKPTGLVVMHKLQLRRGG